MNISPRQLNSKQTNFKQRPKVETCKNERKNRPPKSTFPNDDRLLKIMQNLIKESKLLMNAFNMKFFMSVEIPEI
jgi:hypothetical protein